MKLIFYNDEHYTTQAEEKHREATRYGYSPQHFTKEYLVQTGFYRNHQAIMESGLKNQGCVWKPFILHTVMKNSETNEILVYSDCGDEICPELNKFLIQWFYTHNFMFIQTPHDHRRYTKKYCFKAMDCLREPFLNTTQLDAGFVAFKNTWRTQMFVESWMEWCYNPDVILDHDVDGDEWPDLIRHSRDQSILTNLQLQAGIETIPVQEVINRYIRFNVRD